MSRLPEYVLITPARNEARTIESTIASVTAQTELPLKWVIVSDGSTDGTDEIVTRCAGQHGWIELVRVPDNGQRSFAGKVRAFNLGLGHVRDLPYRVIASLDADITFEKDYIEFLLEKLIKDPRLGLVGTPFLEASSSEIYDYRIVSPEHVSGACQVFRRECFEDIGGYVAVTGGGIDSIASVTARMKGWTTRTFTEKHSVHHRIIGTAEAGLLGAKFRYGAKDYAIGNHPLWELFRCFYQMGRRPIFWGGLSVGAGYVCSALRLTQRPVSPEFVAYHRKEELQRLRKILTGRSTAQVNRIGRKTIADDRVSRVS